MAFMAAKAFRLFKRLSGTDGTFFLLQIEIQFKTKLKRQKQLRVIATARYGQLVAYASAVLKFHSNCWTGFHRNIGFLINILT